MINTDTNLHRCLPQNTHEISTLFPQHHVLHHVLCDFVFFNFSCALCAFPPHFPSVFLRCSSFDLSEPPYIYPVVELYARLTLSLVLHVSVLTLSRYSDSSHLPRTWS